jgi:hypothetical protein
MRFLGLLPIFIFLAACTASKRGYTFNGHLSLDSFAATDIVGDSSSDQVTLESGGTRLKLRAIKPENVTAATNLIGLNIKGLFQPAIAPYPGVVSAKVECPSEFKAVESRAKSDSVEFSGFLLYANDRFGAGECDKANIKYFQYHGILKCPAINQAYELIFFDPYNSSGKAAHFENLIKEIRCS